MAQLSPILKQAKDRVTRSEKALMSARRTMKGLDGAKVEAIAARAAYKALKFAPHK